jgi:hypothetical protein
MIGYARYARGAMTAVTNLALNQSTQTSSVEKGQTDTWAGKFAVDGLWNTRWSSEFSDNQWLSVDLGARKYVAGVNIKWENPAKDFQVQRSDNGTTWTNIKTITGNTDTVHNLLWSPRYMRHLRVKCNVRSNDHGFSIREFEVNYPLHNMKVGVRWDANETPADCEGLEPEDCFARWEKLNLYMSVDDGPYNYNSPIHVVSQSYVNGKSTPTETAFNLDFDKYRNTKIGIIVRSSAVIAGEEVESVDSDPGIAMFNLDRPEKLPALTVLETNDGRIMFEFELHTDTRVGSYMISMSDEAGTGYKELVRRTHEGEKNNASGKGNAIVDRELVFTEAGQTKHFTYVSITSDKFGNIHSRWAPDAEYTWLGEDIVKQVAPVQGLNIQIGE